MAYVPLPISADANLKNRQAAPLLNVCPPPSQPTDAIDIFAGLRQALVNGTPPDAIFRDVTDAARTLTGASGIALALRTGESVVCRARSGEIAPEIGARLDVKLGISGQCFRICKALRCDDTQTDDRVDPEVCRYLGISSIAVVPLRGHNETIGILEAFSCRTYAFSDHQINLLKRLVEIVEVAYDQESGEKCAVLPEPRTVIRPDLFNAAAEALPSDLFDEAADKSPRRFWLWAAVGVLMALMVAIIWISWYEPDEEVASSSQVAPSNPVRSEAPSTLAVLPSKPAAGRAGEHFGRSAVKAPLQKGADADIEPEHGIVLSELPSSPEAASQESPRSPNKEVVTFAEIVEAPNVVIAAADKAALDRLVSVPSKLPDSEVPISQGVTEAVLLHRVMPTYPTQARAGRIEGSVILEATITEQGATRDVKVVSGPPQLVDATTEAVRKWRYRPALLNGKPASVQKQITIVFKAP